MELEMHMLQKQTNTWKERTELGVHLEHQNSNLPEDQVKEVVEDAHRTFQSYEDLICFYS